MNRKLPDLLPWGFALAIAAVMWGAVAVYLAQLERSTIEEAAQRRQNIARSVTEYQASSVRALDMSLAFLRELWRRDPAHFRQAVNAYESLLDDEKVIQIAVLDADGAIAYSHLPSPGGSLNFSDRSYFRFHRDSTADVLHISDPVFGRITRQWAIQFTRAIRDEKGRFAGLVVMAVPPPALEAKFREIGLGEGSVLTLARNDGQILARSADFDRGVRSPLPAWPAMARDSTLAGEFIGQGRVDGVERFFSYRKIPDYGLALLVGQSIAAVMAPYQQQRNFLFVTVSIATFLLMVVAFVVSLRLRDRARYAAQHENLMLDLHDGCIQAIYAVGLRLQGLRKVAGDPMARTIREIEADLNLVIQDLRTVIAGGHVPAYSPEEFLAQVRRSIPETHRTMFELDIDEKVFSRLPPEKSEHVLRIVREAAANVARHAAARHAGVSLSGEGDQFRLEVRDDGCGERGETGARGLGLAHIQARARKLGGKAHVESTPGKGTCVTVNFPA